MKPFNLRSLSLVLIFGMVLLLESSCSSGDDEQAGNVKKIVILTGDKSHPATLHEYIKNARLIKVMLDQATNLENVKTDIIYHGWPEDPSVLDDADLILTISDGRDGPGGVEVPFLTDDRMEIIQEQVDRGCGMMTFHFSTFAPDKYGDKILEWIGGYFDWQNDQGERDWYSDIRFLDVPVKLPSPEHPVTRGVKPFKILEEYYYDLRFKPDDPRFSPIVQVEELQAEHPGGQIVAAHPEILLAHWLIVA